MLLSIITITMNNPEELEETLRSVLDNAKNIEYEQIVINGGKCNQTYNILEKYSSIHCKHPFSKFITINEKDKGIADAFNKGIMQSRGEAIIFLNSGDLLDSSTYFESALEMLSKDPRLIFIHSGITYIDNFAGPIEMLPMKKVQLGRGMPIYHQTMITRRSVFESIGHFKSTFRFAMDYEWICRLYQKGLYIGYYLAESKTPIIMDGQGVSHHHEWKSIKESFLALKSNDILNCKQRPYFTLRFMLFLIRKTLSILKLDSLILIIKMIKYKKIKL